MINITGKELTRLLMEKNMLVNLKMVNITGKELTHILVETYMSVNGKMT